MRKIVTVTLVSINLVILLYVFTSIYSGSNVDQIKSKQNHQSKKSTVMFQYSTINAVMQGQYEGDIDLHEVGKNGDMGLGTINELDGEMVELDGKFYQINGAGKLKKLDKRTKTPFAVTTNFKANKIITLENIESINQFGEQVKTKFDNKNQFHAVRII